MAGSILAVFFLFSNVFAFNVFADDVSSPWTSKETIPNFIASHNAVGLNNQLYLFGGANNDDTSAVYYATETVSGDISPWIATTDLLQNRYWSSNVNKGENIYLLEVQAMMAKFILQIQFILEKF